MPRHMKGARLKSKDISSHGFGGRHSQVFSRAKTMCQNGLDSMGCCVSQVSLEVGRSADMLHEISVKLRCAVEELKFLSRQPITSSSCVSSAKQQLILTLQVGFN